VPGFQSFRAAGHDKYSKISQVFPRGGISDRSIKSRNKAEPSLSWLPIADGLAARHLDYLVRPTRLMAAVKKD
jgi:hypothetical protein